MDLRDGSPSGPEPGWRRPNKFSVRLRLPILFSILIIISAAPLSTPVGLGRILKPDASKIRHLADGTQQYHEEFTNDLLGQHMYTYTAKLAAHTISLEDHPHITAVDCTEQTLTLHVDNIMAAEFWEPGWFFTSTSEAHLCPEAEAWISHADTDSLQSSGGAWHAQPDTYIRRRITALRNVLIPTLSTIPIHGDDFFFDDIRASLPAGGLSAVITFDTETISPHVMFEHLDVHYQRSEPAIEKHLRELRSSSENTSVITACEEAVALARELLLATDPEHAADVRRRLGLFDWLWNAAKKVVNKVVNVVQQAVQVAQAVVTGLWGGNKNQVPVTFININLNGYTFVNSRGWRLWCTECFVRLTGTVDIAIKATWGVPTLLRATMTGGFDAAIGAALQTKSATALGIPPITVPFENDAWANLGIYSFEASGVPFNFAIQGRPSVTLTGFVWGDVYAASPILRYSQTVTFGAEYRDGTLTEIRSFSNAYSISPPALVISSAAAQLKVTFAAESRILLYSVFAFITVGFGPSVIVRGVTPPAPPPPAFFPYDARDSAAIASCNGVSLMLSISFDVKLTIPSPSFTLTAFGVPVALQLPLNALLKLPRTFILQVTPTIPVTIPGLSGCLPFRVGTAIVGVGAAITDAVLAALRAQIAPARLLTDGDIVGGDDAFSRGLQSSCSNSTCTFVVSSWSTCSVDCGSGTMTRTVQCFAIVGGVATLPLPFDMCSTLGATPAQTAACGVACSLGNSSGAFLTVAQMTLNASGYRVGQALRVNSWTLLALTLPEFAAGAGVPSLFVSLAPRQGDMDIWQCDTSDISMSNGTISGAACFAAGSGSGELCTSRRWGLSQESCTMEPAHGVASGNVIYLITAAINASDPATLPSDGTPPPPLAEALPANLLPLVATADIAFIPFITLTAADQLADLDVTLAGAPAAMRHFRFDPSPTSEGIFVSALSYDAGVDPRSIDVYVTPFDGVNWPRLQEMKFSTQRSPPRAAINSTRHRTVTVTGDSFINQPHIITIVATVDCSLQITATDFEPIFAGIALRQRFSVNGLRLYHYQGALTDTLFSAQVFTIAGDADLFVSRVPWARRPLYDEGDDDVQWSSALWASRGYVLDSVSVSSVDPRFGSDWYIAVAGYGTTTDFRIAVQSYEQLEQGVAVQRVQQPSSYSHFLGSAPVVDGRNPPALITGSNATSPDADLAFVSRIAVGPDSFSTFDLLAGSSTRFYPAVYNGFQSLAARNVLGSAMEISSPYLPGTSVARQMIIAVASGYSGISVAAAAATAAAGAASARRLSDPAAINASVTVQSSSVAVNSDGGAEAMIPDLVTTDMFDIEDVAVPESSGLHALRSQDAGRQVGGVDWQHRDRRVTSFSPQPRRLASAATADSEDTAALLTANASARVEFSSQTVVYAPNERTGLWAVLRTCSLSTSFTTCFTVNTSMALYAFRVRVPPRALLYLRVLPLGGVANQSDAAYTFIINVDAVPTADASKASFLQGAPDVNTPFTTYGVTLPGINCAYLGSDLFVNVVNNNPSSAGAQSPMAFAVQLQASSVFGLCPTFSWQTSAWTSCSVQCGNGSMVRTAFCADKTGAVVSDNLCNPAQRPPTTTACNMGACVWSPQDWSDCSSQCNGGTQARVLQCRNGNGQGVVVSSDQCRRESAPPSSQDCNTAACPRVYWAVSPWTACSVTCGKGFQTRTMQCTNGLTGEPIDNDYCYGLPGIAGSVPVLLQTCGGSSCASSAFSIVYFDRRTLEPGRPRIDSIPALAQRYYSYDPPTGSRGVCVRATVMPLSQAVCSISTQRRAFACIRTFQSCMRNATVLAEVGTVAVGTYDPPEWWNADELHDAPPGGCSCFSDALACIATLPRCTSASARAMVSMAMSVRGCPSLNTSEIPQVPTVSGAPGTVNLFATWSQVAYSLSGAQPAVAFAPPSAHTESIWAPAHANTNQAAASFLSDWAPEEYSVSSNQLLITAAAGEAGADLNITLTPLYTFPVAVTGSLLASPTAAAIRAGGLSLTITLLCDSFVPPVAAASALNPGADLTPLGSRLSMNFVAAGITATASVADGWNFVARPALLAVSADRFATVSADNASVTLTLPPIPAYRPTVDETLQFYVPFAVLASGRALQLPDTVFARVRADAELCIVSAWSSWSSCSAMCKDGTQNRSRSVINVDKARVDMSTCPALVESQMCNTCDACAAVQCRNGGLCYGGLCTCPPAWSGQRCELPAMDATSVFWRLSPWTACNSTCGIGAQTRTAACILRSGIEESSVNASIACASLPAPNVMRLCALPACNSTTPLLQVNLSMSVAARSVLASDETTIAFESQLSAEVAAVLRMRPEAVAIQRVSGDTTSSNVYLTVLGGRTALRRLQQVSASTAATIVSNAAGAITALSTLSESSSTPGTLLRRVQWNASVAAVVAPSGATVLPAVELLPSSRQTVGDSSSSSSYQAGLIAGIVVFAVLAGVAFVLVALQQHRASVRTGGQRTPGLRLGVAQAPENVPPASGTAPAGAPAAAAAVSSPSAAPTPSALVHTATSPSTSVDVPAATPASSVA